jgi:hypothetical protein
MFHVGVGGRNAVDSVSVFKAKFAENAPLLCYSAIRFVLSAAVVTVVRNARSCEARCEAEMETAQSFLKF